MDKDFENALEALIRSYRSVGALDSDISLALNKQLAELTRLKHTDTGEENVHRQDQD